jgi:hypothetical protein
MTRRKPAVDGGLGATEQKALTKKQFAKRTEHVRFKIA